MQIQVATPHSTPEGTVPEIDPSVEAHPGLHTAQQGHPDSPTPHDTPESSPTHTPEAEPVTPQRDEPESDIATPIHAPHVQPQRQPGASNRLRARIREILGQATLSEHASTRVRERQRASQIRRLIESNPDLASLAHDTLVETGSFRRIREMIAESLFGETPEANLMAQNVLQEVRMQIADSAIRDAVEFAHNLYPDLTPRTVDMGSPGFASDRDVTLQFRGGGEANVRQRIDASLQAVQRAYEVLAERGISADAVLDTNFYTELHESSIRPEGALEAAQIVFDQSVVSLSEMRMGMNATEWAAYRERQLARLTSSAEPSSMQARMEREARTRMETEFNAAEQQASTLRPEGQTTEARNALLQERRVALREALRRNVSARDIRQLMAEIKLLEPEAYGTRAAVESVPGRQQAWARGGPEAYMQGRQLPEGRVERLAFLSQDASANAGLLFGHSQTSGNTTSTVRSVAKYLERVAHAVVVDGRLPAGRAADFIRNLRGIVETKSMQVPAEANAAAMRLVRSSLLLEGHSLSSLAAMSDGAAMDIWVGHAREHGLDLVAQIRTAEQMAHTQEGGPNPLEPSPPTTPTDQPPSTPGRPTPTEDAPAHAPDTPTATTPVAPAASSLPIVPIENIPGSWRVIQLPLSGGADIIVYRGFARNAESHSATVVREGEIGGILTRALDTANDAIFNQVSRDPVLTGENAAGVVQIRIPAAVWDVLVSTNSVSERGGYPGFSRRINSTELRVNSVEAGRLINSLPNTILPPDPAYDFRLGL